VKDRTTDAFWSFYAALPREVQSVADRRFALLKADRRPPSLHYKRIGPFWSARVTANYRCLGVPRGDEVYWFWIGPHDEYERLIGRA
jgi:hypothetical protein